MLDKTFDLIGTLDSLNELNGFRIFEKMPTVFREAMVLCWWCGVKGLSRLLKVRWYFLNLLVGVLMTESICIRFLEVRWRLEVLF